MMTERNAGVWRLSLIAAFLLPILMFPSLSYSGNADRIREQIEAYLLDNFPWNDLEVSAVRVIGKKNKGTPESVTVEKGPLGHAVFRLRYSDGSRGIVKADVTAYARIIKSRRPFRKNHLIQPGDVYEAKIDVRKMPGSAIQDVNRIIGKSLRRSIIANIPVVEEMIQMSRVVKRGKRVILLLDDGGIRITASGKIREKGFVGHPVRAVNLSSNKEVTGVLINENTVRVEL